MKPRVLRLIVQVAALVLLTQSISSAALPPRCVRLRHLIYVATTTTTLADIANQIGGKKVLVTPLLKANQEVTNPKIYGSMKHAVREAEVLVRLGSGSDPWMHELLKTSGNKTITPGSSLDVDSSAGISKPISSDLIGYYWLDPVNAKTMAASILAGLTSFSPKDSGYFKSNYERFCTKVDENLAKWQSDLSPYKGAKIISCCGTLGYFADRFGMEQVAAIGARPCVSHSSKQVDDIVSLAAKDGGPKIVALEPECPIRAYEDNFSRVSARVVEFPEEVGAKRGVRDYFATMDKAVGSLQVALEMTSSHAVTGAK